MTTLDRLRSARRAVLAALGARAVLWGAALGLAVFAAVVVLAPPSPRTGVVAPLLGAAAGVAVAAWAIARAVKRATLPAVALWVEERVPALDYALVTLAEGAAPAGGPMAERTLQALDARARGVAWEPAVARSARRALGAPALALLAAVVAALVMTGRRAEWRGEATSPRGGIRPGLTPNAAVDRLTPLTVTVVPPEYANRPRVVLRDPSSVSALVGSAVTFGGRGGSGGLAASLGDRPRAVRSGGAGWSTALTMPAKPAAVRLRDGARERWVVLAPVPDSAPDVALTAPARDSVFRTPSGSVALVAELSDDVGLASAAFEYIVSSGEGESFTFRSGTLGRRALGGARQGELRAALSLDALKLGPGDVVHVRAVARDRNSVSGPGSGFSETRTVRVARAGEYDSVALEGAPPPEADKSLVSQRMLLMLTEALQRKRPRLSRAEVLGEARRISADQKRLRKTVGEIVFSRLGDDPGGEHSHAPEEGHAPGEEQGGPPSADDVLREADEATGRAVGEALDFHGDETPVVAINRPLLEAYNAMWDASRELDLGEPGRAIPPMRVALAAIQRARQAERIYLRGRPPAVVVDVAKARLKGEGAASAAPRAPRAPLDDAARARAERLARALAALARPAPGAAVDSLLMLRVDALDGAPALAAALGEAIDALRAGRDATAAIERARQLAGGEADAQPALPAWSGAW